jgi:hypothetical protein
MDIHCNAGLASTDMIGELQGYGTVWYYPDGIANILSLSRVKEQGYRVTYDSQGGNHFTVMKSDGSTCVFNESKHGLYFHDTEMAIEHETLMINTVADNRSNFTNCAYLRALQARKIQQIVGRPSTREFMVFVDKNRLPNYPISRADIVAAEKLFGPDIRILKGKTVRKTSPGVEVSEVTILSELMSQYCNVVDEEDVMYISKLPFFVTMSQNI